MRILVLGLGRSGTSLVRFLLARGDQVTGYDADARVFERENIQGFQKTGLAVWDRASFGFDLVIASPGIPEDAEVIRTLRAQNVRLIDEIEFGFEIVGRRIVAVTGTNGKSTTTALIGEILRADDRNTFYGGNLAPGMPFSSALLEESKDLYVLEVSSFQLERCEKFAPKVGLLLNVSPDHLNRHGDLERYRQLKLSLFRNQTRDDFAIINQDDRRVMEHRGQIPATVLTFSLVNQDADARLEAGVLSFRGDEIVHAADLRLPGRHNVANALAAIAATRVLGVKPESIVRILTTFTGLEHRLEPVAVLDGVKYVNNSMCTNPAAAVESLRAFDAPVILITGGREKGLPIDDYLKAILVQAKATILVGENRQRLYDELRRLGYEPVQVAESLAEAIRRARALGKAGDVVLFSPGFASFDSYPDFIERGRAFKQAVYEEGVAK
jgi:UDP-N-acetylmuramoylalanine--D-glutamate ligase